MFMSPKPYSYIYLLLPQPSRADATNRKQVCENINMKCLIDTLKRHIHVSQQSGKTQDLPPCPRPQCSLGTCRVGGTSGADQPTIPRAMGAPPSFLSPSASTKPSPTKHLVTLGHQPLSLTRTHL